ncbi:MAG: aldo/keto reductase, partial [Gemmatimonadetes bacterium]|nr:aldo/keto reductase [Gemmatimonadota bacterium]
IKAMAALMHAAIDEGINFFDNAWGYSNGASEIRMGKVLSGGYRDRVFLMTKDASRHPKRAIVHLEESLRRLQTDVIDLWQFHNIKQPDDPERIYEQGLLEAVLKAKEEGKIRYIGFTGHTLPSLHVEMIERGFTWDATQMPINVFDPHYLSFVDEVLPVAVEKNIGVIAMKTLGGRPEAILATGVATVTECLRYAMSLPVATVCSGMDSLEKLRQNADIARQFAPLAADEQLALLSRTKELGMQGTRESYKAR